MKKSIVGFALLCGSLLQSVQAEWVYIGEFGADGPLSSGFDLHGVPAAGESIRALKGMNLRDAPPQQQEGGWQLGAVQGVIYPGERFVVESVVASRRGVVAGDVWVSGTVQR